MVGDCLILTLPPLLIGGVTAKARLLADSLKRAGRRVEIAFYDLPGAQETASIVFRDFHHHAIKSNFRGLEPSNTAFSPEWSGLIRRNKRHIAVGGSILIANPLSFCGVRHMVWCAADLHGDRKYRKDSMPWWRKPFDTVLIEPSLRRQELAVLRANNCIFGVSDDTVRRLRALAGPAVLADIYKLPIPVDTRFFFPKPTIDRGWEIGFAGRLDDPRKNASLLFEALGILQNRGFDVNLLVTGEGSQELCTLAARIGVLKRLKFVGILPAEKLRNFYQGLRLLVIPSFHEGLGIVGLEAMACGIPVVSTDCGGPEDYVLNGQTGQICCFDPENMADAILTVGDQGTWQRYSLMARSTVCNQYALEHFDAAVARAWRRTWNEVL